MSKPASYVGAGILADDALPEDLAALVPAESAERVLGVLFRVDAELSELRGRRELLGERERANTATLIETKEHQDVEEAAEAVRIERERLLDVASFQEKKAALKKARKALSVTKPAREARQIEAEKKEIAGAVAERIATVRKTISRSDSLAQLLGRDHPAVLALRRKEAGVVDAVPALPAAPSATGAA